MGYMILIMLNKSQFWMTSLNYGLIYWDVDYILASFNHLAEYQSDKSSTMPSDSEDQETSILIIMTGYKLIITG